MKFYIDTTWIVAPVINKVTGHCGGVNTEWRKNRRCPVTVDMASAVIEALEAAAAEDERAHAAYIARETANGNEHNVRKAQYTNPGGDHRRAIATIRARLAKLGA